MEKLNMVIGAFFSTLGTPLLARLTGADARIGEVKQRMVVTATWDTARFKDMQKCLDDYSCSVSLARVDLEDFRKFLVDHEEFLLRLVQAGGNVVAGTDAPAVMPGVSLHREMEFLVEAGLSPMQAIQGGTKVGAQYLGQEKQLGTVEEGKLADLILIRGYPLTEIAQTRTIDLVIKDGAILDTSYPQLAKQPFHVVVTDLRLGKESGMDVLRDVRELQPGAEVLVVTGYGSVDSAVAVMKEGADDYLTKPVEPETLLHLVHKALEQAASEGSHHP